MVFHLDLVLSNWMRSISADASRLGTTTYSQSATDLNTAIGPWIWHNGVERAMRNIVTTISSLMRNLDVGDNSNATTLAGRVQVSEVYFKVRWPWICVIVAETVCIAVLLVITIHISRKDSLVKDSTFAYLLHGSETIRVPQPETNTTLDELAKTITVRLEENGDGNLRFRKKS